MGTEELIESFLAGMPSTMPGYLLHVFIAVLVCMPVFSITEVVAHGYLMHKKLFPPVVHRLLPKVEDFYQRHEVRHHNKFYRQFDYEPDPVGKYDNLRFRRSHYLVIGILLAPFAFTLMYISPVSAVMFVICCVVHNLVWSLVHTQMHIPKDVFWKDWAYFRLLARHHFMHHQDPSRNFNIVIPMADYLIGTYKKPEFGDIREMIRLGYIKPKTSTVRRMVKSLQPRPAYAYDSGLINQA